MPIIDKTKEEAGKGYQILGASMPKNNNLQKSEVTFWQAVSDGAKGVEKWFNIFTNGIIMIALFIIIIYIFYHFIYFLYKLALFFI